MRYRGWSNRPLELAAREGRCLTISFQFSEYSSVSLDCETDMSLSAVGYVSEAIVPWERDTIDAMVSRASAFNLQAGVTGVLFFDGNRYLQYIEGPDDGVDIVFSRIKSSALHRDLMELASGPIGRRMLPYWSMRWLLAGPSPMRTMARADWAGFTRSSSRRHSPKTAMEHVHRYLEPYIGGPMKEGFGAKHEEFVLKSGCDAQPRN